MTAPKTSPSTSLPDKQSGSSKDTSDTSADTAAAEVADTGAPFESGNISVPVPQAEAKEASDSGTNSDAQSTTKTISEPTGAAKVAQVQPGQRRGAGLKAVGRPGLKVSGTGRPGLKSAGSAGLRKQPSLDVSGRDAPPPKTVNPRPSAATKIAKPAMTGSVGPAGPKAGRGNGAGQGPNTRQEPGQPARNRSPEDVQERANRRAETRARQAEQTEQAAQDEVDPSTLPVPKPKGKPPAKNARQKKNEKKVVVVRPPAQPAKVKTRHWMTFFSFLVMVALPMAVAGWYLWNRAADQYASYVGFSVRTEEVGSSIEILGIATDVSGSSTSDTDILYEFLQGQELVRAIDDDLDLRNIWSKADPDVDPIFTYHPPGTIEDLTSYWSRMVKIYYDPGTGLMDLRVLAFDPQDATAIATQIRDRSSAMINKLSAVAREDAIRYARDELSQAEDRLREARVEIQSFRNRTQLIDPTMQTQTQSGLIGALEGELANAQIELRLLQETARENDPRIRQGELRIEVIERQINEERSELGLEGVDDNISVADLVGEYEALAVDLEFAQQAYTTALATFVSAQNEARRQTRYLAPHVNPTKAEKSQYPDRIQIMILMSLLLGLIWAITILTGYALRDRR